MSDARKYATVFAAAAEGVMAPYIPQPGCWVVYDGHARDTPPHLAPWVPPVRNRSVGVRFELGQIAPEPVPPPAYSPLPHGSIGDGLPHSLERRACPDCTAPYQPNAWNQERCPPCGRLYRLAKATERKKTDRTRKSEPRPVSARTQQIRATRAIDQATRDRARKEHAAKRRQAA